MTASQHPSGTAAATRAEGPALSPKYSPGARRGTVQALFGNGKTLSVETSRARAYPGLRSEAPRMAVFYEAFAGFFAPGARVLDAGCGAGAGARALQLGGLDVTAVDDDETAVAFASHHAPELRVVRRDLAAYQADEPFDGAILADVLAHAADPEVVLMAVSRALAGSGRLLVAEPTAHVSQRLTAPQRRAFSASRLRSLLVCAGFTVEAVLSNGVPFVALLARLTHPSVREAFAGAYSLAGRGRLAEALSALEGARDTGRLEVEVELSLARSELHMALGSGDAAAEACFRVRELEPREARALVGLGRISLSSGAPSDALHLALDALRCNGTEAAACTLAALAAGALGHPDALTAWRAAANLVPDDPAIACELARTASRFGDPALGLHCLERVERYGTPLGPEHHLTRAWVLIAAGRKTEAELEARIAEARDADPESLDELRRALV